MMKMKACVLIARCLLGFIYLIFGLDYFYQFIPYHVVHPGIPGALVAGLKGTGYIYPMMKTIQILGGVSLLFDRYAPFSAVVLFPISLNVLLFHTILVPSGWFMGIILIVLNVFLGWAYRKYYQGMFTVKPVL
jgi:putative oxidoreductase